MTEKEQISLLKWDTDFFGFKTGKLNLIDEELGNLLCICKKKEFRLVYLFSDPENKSLHEKCRQNGGILVDEKVTFEKKPVQSDPIAKDIEFYKLSLPEVKLYDLALQSGVYSRFNLDHNFTRDIFPKMYKEWIEKSVNGIMADKVLVYKVDNSIAGFVSLSLKKDFAQIGLIAVDSKFRNKSIGKKLIQASEKICLDKNVNNLVVVTQKANSIEFFTTQFSTQRDFK
ncbi:MAG: GNAT family N-acetyltransferase [Bacteroidales bacterium]|nr:GNAT family N-acetyltransferase [Bacteroidales bacterium]